MFNVRTKRRFYGVLWGMACVSLAVGLMLYALKNQIELYKTPAQVDAALYHTDRIFRLGGQVKPGSVRYHYQHAPQSHPQAQPPLKTATQHTVIVYFELTDESKKNVPIVYHGLIPTLFREGKGAIVSGKFNAQGVFLANSLLAKHDENYQPPQSKSTQ